jgi:NADPH:quinone reductase-like Zn-dependent oxidoreductase
LRGSDLARRRGSRRVRITALVSEERAGDLERLSPFLEAGTVTPSVDRTYPLAEAPEAMRRLEAGQARGKVAITVAEDAG